MPEVTSVEETAFHPPLRDRGSCENVTSCADTLTKAQVVLDIDTWSISTSIPLKDMAPTDTAGALAGSPPHEV